MGFGKKLSGLGWRIAISPCVGVKSLADDLVVYDGRVNSRVVLLLRAIERNPSGDPNGARSVKCRLQSNRRAGRNSKSVERGAIRDQHRALALQRLSI
jgi:hypothetical protein